MNKMIQIILIVQAIYYLATGLWAILSIESFQKITGPKHDLWLVKTVAVLVIVIGSALLTQAFYLPLNPSIQILALGSAIGFIIIDSVYAGTKAISKIYFLDALAQLLILLGWSLAL